MASTLGKQKKADSQRKKHAAGVMLPMLLPRGGPAAATPDGAQTSRDVSSPARRRDMMLRPDQPGAQRNPWLAQARDFSPPPSTLPGDYHVFDSRTKTRLFPTHDPAGNAAPAQGVLLERAYAAMMSDHRRRVARRDPRAVEAASFEMDGVPQDEMLDGVSATIIDVVLFEVESLKQEGDLTDSVLLELERQIAGGSHGTQAHLLEVVRGRYTEFWHILSSQVGAMVDEFRRMSKSYHSLQTSFSGFQRQVLANFEDFSGVSGATIKMVVDDQTKALLKEKDPDARPPSHHRAGLRLLKKHRPLPEHRATEKKRHVEEAQLETAVTDALTVHGELVSGAHETVLGRLDAYAEEVTSLTDAIASLKKEAHRLTTDHREIARRCRGFEKRLLAQNPSYEQLIVDLNSKTADLNASQTHSEMLEKNWHTAEKESTHTLQQLVVNMNLNVIQARGEADRFGGIDDSHALHLLDWERNVSKEDHATTSAGKEFHHCINQITALASARLSYYKNDRNQWRSQAQLSQSLEDSENAASVGKTFLEGLKAVGIELELMNALEQKMSNDTIEVVFAKMLRESLTLGQLPEYQQCREKRVEARTDGDRMTLDMHEGVTAIMQVHDLSFRDVELLLVLKEQHQALKDVYLFIESEKIDVLALTAYRDIHDLCKNLGLDTEHVYRLLLALKGQPGVLKQLGLDDMVDLLKGIPEDRFVPSMKDIPEPLLKEGPRKALENQLESLLGDEETRQKLLDAGYSLEELDEMMAKGDSSAVLKALAVVGAVDADMLMKNLFGDDLPPGALDKQVQSLLGDPAIRAQLLEKGYSVEEMEQMIKDGNASQVMLLLTKEGIADIDTWTKAVAGVEDEAIFVKTGQRRKNFADGDDKKVQAFEAGCQTDFSGAARADPKDRSGEEQSEKKRGRLPGGEKLLPAAVRNMLTPAVKKPVSYSLKLCLKLILVIYKTKHTKDMLCMYKNSQVGGKNREVDDFLDFFSGFFVQQFGLPVLARRHAQGFIKTCTEMSAVEKPHKKLVMFTRFLGLDGGLRPPMFMVQLYCHIHSDSTNFLVKSQIEVKGAQIAVKDLLKTIDRYCGFLPLNSLSNIHMQVKAMGQQVQEDQGGRTISMVDLDSTLELVMQASEQFVTTQEEVFEKLYRTVDRDGAGFVSLEEFETVFNQFRPEQESVGFTVYTNALALSENQDRLLWDNILDVGRDFHVFGIKSHDLVAKDHTVQPALRERGGPIPPGQTPEPDPQFSILEMAWDEEKPGLLARFEQLQEENQDGVVYSCKDMMKELETDLQAGLSGKASDVSACWKCMRKLLYEAFKPRKWRALRKAVKMANALGRLEMPGKDSAAEPATKDNPQRRLTKKDSQINVSSKLQVDNDA